MVAHRRTIPRHAKARALEEWKRKLEAEWPRGRRGHEYGASRDFLPPQLREFARKNVEQKKKAGQVENIGLEAEIHSS